MDKFQKELALQVETLDKMAVEQPLLFLQEAGTACDVYTKQMRRMSKGLRSLTVGPASVYQLWLGEYMPKIDKIKITFHLGNCKDP